MIYHSEHSEESNKIGRHSEFISESVIKQTLKLVQGDKLKIIEFTYLNIIKFLIYNPDLSCIMIARGFQTLKNFPLSCVNLRCYISI